MKLSRHSLMAAVLMASGLVFTMLGSAHAQRATYRTISGHGGHGCPCPTDCPPSEAGAPTAEGDEGMDDDMGEDLPEVADLTSDASFASASQSAAPNAIGDSLGPGIEFEIDDDFEGTFPTPGGGRFKATNNNNAIPQCRAFFNYNYYDNIAEVENPVGPGDRSVNLHRYELGLEHAFWCGMASVQVRVPFFDSLDSTIDLDAALSDDTQFGNMNVSLKGVVLQDCCKTVSVGLGIDLPTAEDLTVFEAGDFTFVLENDSIILSPYLAAYNRVGCNAFVNSFAQVAIPVNENDVSIEYVGGPTFTGDLAESTLLYLDVSVGYWLRQDCCGNGIAALAELHYTNVLDGDVAIVDPGETELEINQIEILNATAGVVIVNGCWSIAPALVLPVLQQPDRVFDWEAAVYVNRRF